MLTVGVFKIVVAGVADVEYVSDAERLYHLRVLRVLPLAEVDALGEHLVAEALLLCDGPGHTTENHKSALNLDR